MRVLFLGLAIFISSCTSTDSKENSDTEIKSPQNYVIGKNEKVEGKNLNEYANIWWQWTKTMPDQESPLRDRTGDKCHVNQNGEVWFLAGGYGTSKIRRTCVVPAGKYIFFPVINMVYWPKRGAELSCDSVKNSAALNNDELLSIYVELNGQEIREANNYRIASEQCFNLLGLIPEKYNAPKVYPTATDGYWIMLKPLAAGTHKLKFYAQYNRSGGAYGEMAQDIEYEIVVK